MRSNPPEAPARRQKAANTRLAYRFERWVARTRFVHWIHRPILANVVAPLIEAVSPSLRDYDPPLGPKSLAIPELPPELRGQPGNPRDRTAAEAELARKGPLPIFGDVHWEADEYMERNQWRTRLHASRKKKSSLKAASKADTGGLPPPRPTGEMSPAALNEAIRAKAAELGISAVGVTEPDPTVMFTNGAVAPHETRVVVGVLEQHWAATQTIPSLRANMAHYEASYRLRDLMVELSEFIIGLGFTARIDTPRIGMAIAFAVEAGLGQLGLNGQLLTPFAGSRSRIQLLFTNAPLPLDSPVDYGIEKICDACRACVRNCPSGAIRATRDWNHGTYKATIKSERCLPVVSVTHDCGICQKVCPVQRYGLPAVIDEYAKTGTILGRDTDELEGYIWPVDGRFYGPGERPPVREQQVLGNPEFIFDRTRWDRPTLNADLGRDEAAPEID